MASARAVEREPARSRLEASTVLTALSAMAGAAKTLAARQATLVKTENFMLMVWSGLEWLEWLEWYERIVLGVGK